MAHLTIELILWLLLVFFIGCIIGFLLRWLFSAEPAKGTVAMAGAATAAAAVTTASATRNTAASVPVAPRVTQPDVKAPAPSRPLAAALPAVPKAAPQPIAPRAVQPEVKADPIPAIIKASVEAPASSKPLPSAKPLPVALPVATATPKVAAKPKSTTAKTPTAKSRRPRATGKPKRPRGMAKARRGKADDLQQISGIGPKLEKTLGGLGFFHFNQIADWNSDEVMWVDEHLRFKGRITRDEWIPQAKLLAAGNLTKFAKLYGTGGMQNAKGQTKSGSRTRRSK